MAAYDVFISYSTANKAVADAVVADFEQHNIRCFYAPRNIPPGVEWASAITAAMNAASVCVLIFTAESNASKQVKNEVAMAFNAEKTIIPFKLTNEALSAEMQYYLARVHWLDATVGLRSRKILELRETVQRILYKTPAPGRGNPGTARPGGVNPGTARPGGVNPGAARPRGVNPGTARPGGVNPGAAKPGAAKPQGSTGAAAAPAKGTGSIKRKFICFMVIVVLHNIFPFINRTYEFNGKGIILVGFIAAVFSLLIVLLGKGSAISGILGAISAFVSSLTAMIVLMTLAAPIAENSSVQVPLLVALALLSLVIAGYIAVCAFKCAESLKK